MNAVDVAAHSAAAMAYRAKIIVVDGWERGADYETKRTGPLARAETVGKERTNEVLGEDDDQRQPIMVVAVTITFVGRGCDIGYEIKPSLGNASLRTLGPRVRLEKISRDKNCN